MISADSIAPQCLADLHIISWINRLIAVAGGEPNESGLSALQGQLDGWIIGPRVRSFWSAWTQRESFKRTLVPASKAFQATRGTSDGLLQLESQRQKARMHH